MQVCTADMDRVRLSQIAISKFLTPEVFVCVILHDKMVFIRVNTVCLIKKIIASSTKYIELITKLLFHCLEEP